MRWSALLLLLLASVHAADIRGCVCDLARPETAQDRACGLCRLTEQAPPFALAYLVKDNAADKPNRWLALPREHRDGANPLAQMSATERAAWLSMAVEKGRELWGADWGVAVNSDLERTQCHAHAHIGKLLPRADEGGFFLDSLTQIPAIADNSGLLLHQVGGRLHAHTEIAIPEYRLMP